MSYVALWIVIIESTQLHVYNNHGYPTVVYMYTMFIMT